MLRPFDPSMPFSVLPHPSRNRIADLVNLYNFIDQLYHPHIDASFEVQTWGCLGIVLFYLILASSVILRRLFQRRAWFFKMWTVAGGTFVIPNSVMAFLFCQGLFAIVWVGYCFVTIRHYSRQEFQKWYLLYKVLVFFPLWLGGWWNAFGIVSAFPEALMTTSRNGRFKRLILSPCAFNVACWLTPIVQFVSILIPSLMAAHKYNSSLDDFEAWRKLIETAQEGVISETTFSTLQANGLGLWLDVKKAYWYMAIAFTCWDFWAVVCLIIHVPVGAHTLSRIRAQLEVAKMKSQAVSPVIVMKDVDEAASKVNSQGLGTTASRVFPPMRESSTPTQARSMPSKTIEQRRLQIIQKLYKNLLAHYCGICVAIVCFLASSLLVTKLAYDSMRDNNIGLFSVGGDLSASWTIIVFGGVTLLSIFRRSFDPSLSIDISDDEPAPSAPWPVMVAIRKRAVSCGWRKRYGRRIQRDPSTVAEEAGIAPEFTLSEIRQTSSKKLEAAHSSQSSLVDANCSPFHLEKIESRALAERIVHNEASALSVPLENRAAAEAECPSLAAPSAVFHATPFGKILSDDVPIRTCSNIRPRTASSAMLEETGGEKSEELNAIRRYRSLSRRASSLRKPSASSFLHWRRARSVSSVSTIQTYVALQDTEKFASCPTVSPSSADFARMSRFESDLERGRRASNSSARPSASSTETETRSYLLHIDMDAPCFVSQRALPRSAAILQRAEVASDQEKSQQRPPSSTEPLNDTTAVPLSTP
ncbi:uncharacterized protein MEPE_01051 [Melanopsichium pennsylvanicum]|uniref:Uncharacterized protein n=2 Tax=Melanopsichium pennsylvanicum TaxID=63383 RepID=A0AAJ4XHS0_9BASI|nr:conserved hypothetical Ustilago-specific protein [Melanopsichium pennsylvanicum 4]SNX82345.1 uncharacterized protein MEPE_01051 [Melanopsichium pennsylvanicum]